MEQVRQCKKYWECFQVEKGRLKDKLFSVFTFLLSFLESKDQLPSITSENPFVAELRLEGLRWGERTLNNKGFVQTQAPAAQTLESLLPERLSACSCPVSISWACTDRRLASMTFHWHRGLKMPSCSLPTLLPPPPRLNTQTQEFGILAPHGWPTSRTALRATRC